MSFLKREKKVCRRCCRPIPYLNGKFVEHNIVPDGWKKKEYGRCIGSGDEVGNSSKN